MSQLGSHHLHHHLHHHHHQHRLAESHHHHAVGSRAGSPSSSGPSGTAAAAAGALPASSATGNAGSTSAQSPAGKRGHQRRQSVARLLPDISKLRLLSWLVEASSELINCDIAIMDGVYAKLNRSRESLLFWHPPVSSNLQTPPRRVPPRPAPPQRQPVPNRLVLQQRRPTAGAENQRRNHHSLPVAAAAAVAGSPRASHKADSLPQPGSSSSSSCDRRVHQPTTEAAKKRLCDSNNPQDKPHESDEDDDSSSSSASSGIHAHSLSSSASSSGSLSSSGASSSTEDPQQSASLPPQVSTNQHQQQQQQSGAHRQPAAPSSAEQLREKIIKTVMEHQHLQNLLVNIIRQHDRRRQQLQRQRARHMSLDLYPGRDHSPTGAGGCREPAGAPPRIDLADIADALDDGCLCTCHSFQQHQHPSSERPFQATGTAAATKERSSTLPPSGSLTQQVAATSPVRSKTVGRGSAAASGGSSGQKKSGARGASESQQVLPLDSSNRQDIINLMADRLCENCFETHYWLHGCLLDGAGSASTSANAQPAAATASLPAAGSGAAPGSAGKGSRSATVNGDTSSLQAANQNHLNALISSRNANFIKLVQQQVRATISNSIELIDLIRREIKLPESIKQKQLMRCFSASIQLLTSVGNYVVPAQDISSFLPEVGAAAHHHNHHNNHQRQQQQQQRGGGSQDAAGGGLYTLPPSDFDNIHYLHQMSQQHSPLHPLQPLGAHHLAPGGSHLGPELNYHLAAAPEIPLRRSIRSSDPILASCAASLKQQSASKRNDTTHQLEASAGSHTPLSTTTTSAAPAPADQVAPESPQKLKSLDEPGRPGIDSSSGASSNNSSASSSIARAAVQQSSLTRAVEAAAANHQSAGSCLELASKASHGGLSASASLSRQPVAPPLPPPPSAGRHHRTAAAAAGAQVTEAADEDLLFLQHQQASRSNKFWQSSKFNFIKKLLHVRQQRILRQQSKDRKIYNNKVQNKFRLVMMDLTHFNKSQQLLATENGVNSLLTSMRNVLEFGLYLTLKLY